MRISTSIVKYPGLLLMCCLSFQVMAQNEIHTDPFYALIDSLKSLDRQRKMEPAQLLGEQLMVEATSENSVRKLIEIHKVMFNVNMHSQKYDVFRDNALACLRLSRESEDYYSVITCAKFAALTFFVSSEYDSAKKYYTEALVTARDHLPEEYPIAIANMAFIHGIMDQRDEELKYYMLALQVVEAHPEYNGTVATSAKAYSGLGDYYRSIGEFEKAIDNYKGKLELGKQNGYKEFEYEAYYGLGLTYADEGYYDFEKSERNFQIVASDTSEVFEPYRYEAIMGLAKLYRREKDYTRALELFNDALNHYQTTRSRDYVSIVQHHLGELYFEMGELGKARKWVNLSLEGSRQSGVIARERNTLWVLYRLDSTEGRFKDAFFNFLRYTGINDSLSSQETKNRISELQIRYETEQTNKQNELLKADLDVQELRAQRQVGILIFAGVVSLLLVVSTTIFYRGYKRKKQDHDIIASQKNELKQLSDFKEGLTSMVVHDMKNPINSIIGFSRGTPDEKKMKKINQSGYNILNLVTNMLDIQRFEEAKVEVQTEPVEGRNMVNQAINEVHLLLQAKSLRFDNLVPKGIVVDVERALIDRVLVNLLTNAIKYSPLGSTITVKPGEASNGFQEMVVIDEGEGIPEEKLPYIFNKFWHKDSRKSGLAPSTGLGLSFCKLAIEAHGGTIRAATEAGLGTSMIFTLPLTSEAASEISTEEPIRLEEEGTLSAGDLDILADFLPDLARLEVHEVSAINKLIRQLENSGVNKKWTGALQACVYLGDQAKYNELLSDQSKNII